MRDFTVVWYSIVHSDVARGAATPLSPIIKKLVFEKRSNLQYN